MATVLLHGPHLSQLGPRDPAHDGTSTHEDEIAVARAEAEAAGAPLGLVRDG